MIIGDKPKTDKEADEGIQIQPPVEVKKEKYVTTTQFGALVDVIKDLAKSVNEIKDKPSTPAATAEAEEIRKAKADQAPINPAWEDKAREIIGEAVDHCECFYPKSGGVHFTVIIKPEFSNAPKDYMERMKSDRRTKEIGSEGMAGVENWCKLIRSNLKRTANK